MFRYLDWYILQPAGHFIDWDVFKPGIFMYLLKCFIKGYFDFFVPWYLIAGGRCAMEKFKSKVALPFALLYSITV